MNSFLKFIFYFVIIIQSPRLRSQSISALLKEAQIMPSDTPAVRVAKLLVAINDNNFIRRKDPLAPKNRSQLNHDERAQGIEIIKKYGFKPDNGRGSSSWRYHLDSQRSPQEIAEQCVGGFCGSVALITAQALIDSGIPSDQIRIASAITSSELAPICEGRKGKPFNKNHGGFGNGHVFVMIQDAQSKEWKIVNTTHSIEGELDRAHVPEVRNNPSKHHSLSPRRGKNWNTLERAYINREFNGFTNQQLQNLDWSDIESEPIESPEFITSQLNDPKSTQFPLKSLPKFPSLPDYFNDTLPNGKMQKTPFQPLSIFHISKVEDYPRHTYQQRFNLIASGKVDDPTCRWGEFGETNVSPQNGESAPSPTPQPH